MCVEYLNNLRTRTVARDVNRTGTRRNRTVTKKHFEAFAREIAAAIEEGISKQEAVFAAYIIIRVASRGNPRFDQARFMKACGL